MRRSKWPLMLLWVPISVLLLLLHVLPLTSIWANYVRHKWKKACLCTGHQGACCRRLLRVPTFLCLGVGIVVLYLMVSEA